MNQNINESTNNSSRKSLSTRTNNPKNKLLYLECQWKPHKSIIVDLKLSKPTNIQFRHKVHNRSEQYWNLRATEEPRAGFEHGHSNSQSGNLL